MAVEDFEAAESSKEPWGMRNDMRCMEHGFQDEISARYCIAVVTRTVRCHSDMSSMSIGQACVLLKSGSIAR